jgi:uncharacterized protein (TIGR02145 family)
MLIQLSFFSKSKRDSIRTVYFVIITTFLLFSFSCNNTNPTGNNNDLPTFGTMTDVDGHAYKTIKIGNQVWMAENLRTNKYSDLSDIPYVSDSTSWVSLKSAGFCYYNNTKNEDSINKFGALYNWYTVESNKLAPAGWHIPSDSDWDTLQEYLINNGYNYDGTTNKNKIAKALAAKTDWLLDSVDSGAIGNNLAKNNLSGFSAFPSGCYFGKFYGIGHYGLWWTNSKADTSFYIRVLSYTIQYLIRDSLSLNQHVGGAIRLIQDN